MTDPAPDWPPLPDRPRGRTPRFFDDGAADTLVRMLLELAQAQWVTRARLAALEHWAATEVTGARVPWSEDYPLPADAEARLTAERDAFVAAVMGPIADA